MNNPSLVGKRILLLSWNPVPVINSYKNISATGIRVFKLAKGLSGEGSEVTIAVKNGDNKKNIHFEDIKIIAWDSDKEITALTNNYDVLIINANYGFSALEILKNSRKELIKVIDAFIPYYFEDALIVNKVDASYDKQHLNNLEILHNVFCIADLILVANKEQKLMYLGAFGGTNLINAKNIEKFKDNFVICPPGIIKKVIGAHNPYLEYSKIIKKRKIVVWFGPSYYWYDIDLVFHAYKSSARLRKETILFVIGIDNKEFNNKSKYSIPSDLINKDIIFIPWVDFDKRIQWLKHANLGVVVNKLTFENIFSFRNRLLDFIEAKLPFVTNGNDPFGEEIIGYGGALKIDYTIESAIIRALDEKVLMSLNNGSNRCLKKLDNKNTIKSLVEAISVKKHKNKLNTSFLSIPREKEKELNDKISDLTYKNNILNQKNKQLEKEIKLIKTLYEQLPKSLRDHFKYSIRYRIKNAGRKK